MLITTWQSRQFSTNLIQPVSCQNGYKDTVGICVKGHTSGCAPSPALLLPAQLVISSEKAIRMAQHDSSPVNPRWLFPVTFLTSGRIYSVTFPVTEGRLRGSPDPPPRRCVAFAFFCQSSGTTHDHRHLWPFAVTLASSISMLGCIPPGPMDLCISS